MRSFFSFSFEVGFQMIMQLVSGQIIYLVKNLSIQFNILRRIPRQCCEKANEVFWKISKLDSSHFVLQQKKLALSKQKQPIADLLQNSLKMSRYSQENTCVGVFFLNKVVGLRITT